MASTQALAVFLQNWPVCAECMFPQRVSSTGPVRCVCESMRDLTQASRTMRSRLLATMGAAGAPTVSEAASDSDVSSDAGCFDEERIEYVHHQICEWCSPFQSDSCMGTRMCREMAGFAHGLACQRMSYVCRGMPKSNPRDYPLRERIVALALSQASCAAT